MRSIFILALLTACGNGAASPAPGGARGPARFPVETRPVQSQRVEYSINAVGSVDAFEKVQVTARVAGAVDRVLFSEGKEVKAGESLVEIDPQRYKVALSSAQAALAKAESTRGDAQAGLGRREKAVADSPGLISGEEIEGYRTRVRSAEADVAAARAAVDLARINLQDAYVRAPVTGIIETRTVQTGQYLQPGAVLATLVRRDPLLLRFQVPVSDALRLKPGLPVRFKTRADERTLNAKISHVAGSADETSRMVSVVGDIETTGLPPDLRPGAFAEVTIPVAAAADVLVVPQQAVRPSEKGFLAYVVKDGVAQERVLELGMRTENGLVEVRSGLSAGEALVVRGAEALRDGAPVAPTGG